MARPLVGGISAAAAAGHAAFFCTGAAFLATDIMYLRTISMGSISLAMVFQYYRPQPLRMPLRWNAIFLLINCGMAGALYSERQEAEDMTEEMVEIFEGGLFRDRGFSKVDFYRLFGLAQKEVIKKGDYLKRTGSVSNKLFYIVSGSASIKREEVFLSSVSEHDFAGEIDLIRYLTESKKIPDAENADEVSFQMMGDENPPAEAINLARESCVVESDEMTVYVWDFLTLKDFLVGGNQRAVSNALHAYIGHEMREKLEDAWNIRVEDDRDKAHVQQLAVDYLFGGLGERADVNEVR